MSWWGNRLLASAHKLLPVGLLVLAGGATDSAIRPRYPEDDRHGAGSAPSPSAHILRRRSDDKPGSGLRPRVR